MLSRNMTIGAAIAALTKDAADRQTAAAILNALIATGSSTPVTTTRGSPSRRRGRGGIAQVAIEIIQAAGRPLHGLTEILPELQARGIKVSKAGLPTTLMRAGLIVRTAPGTYGLRDGFTASSGSASTKD